MVLSDRDIRKALAEGHLVIDSLNDDRIQPASVDLTLDYTVLVPPPYFKRSNWPTGAHSIDLNNVKGGLDKEPWETHHTDNFTLSPGEFILGSTIERVEIPDFLVARVEGKSSLGRLGLLVHATAGYIDPGFKGKITLEIYNLNYRTIVLHPEKAICQLSFGSLTSPAEYPYGHEKIGSRYQNQDSVTASRYEDILC